jgi:hypothetical protein
MTAIPRSEETLCAVCRRRSAGYGHMQKAWGTQPILWVCDDPDCLQAAKDSYGMRQHEFDRLERLAAADASNKLVETLVASGKAEAFAAWDSVDFDRMVEDVIATYRASLKHRVITGEAPF